MPDEHAEAHERARQRLRERAAAEKEKRKERMKGKGKKREGGEAEETTKATKVSVCVASVCVCGGEGEDGKGRWDAYCSSCHMTHLAQQPGRAQPPPQSPPAAQMPRTQSAGSVGLVAATRKIRTSVRVPATKFVKESLRTALNDDYLEAIGKVTHLTALALHEHICAWYSSGTLG